MRIKNKTLILVVISVLFVVSFTLTIMFFASKDYIRKQENRDVIGSFKKIDSILEKEKEDMKSRVLDYSNWNDTYQFIIDKSNNYIESNFEGNTLEKLRVNAIIYMDDSGQEVFTKTFGLEDEEFNKLRRKVFEENNNFINFSGFQSNNDVHNDLILSDEKVFIVTASPITTSDEQAKSNGVLVMIRLLDDAFIDYISKVTYLDIKFINKEDFNVNSSEIKMIQRSDIYIEDTVRSIEAFKSLKDISGEESIVCAIKLDREYFNEGVYYFLVFSIVFVVLIIIVVSCIYQLADKKILKRIKVLHDFMENVGNTKDTSAVVEIEGNDEISELAASTNKMLAELNSAYKEIVFLSYSDKLTGLKNRAYIEKRLSELDAEGKTNYSIILGDLNGLKIRNDTFGHKEGDNLLCTIANILKTICEDDDIVARFGGDEFVILIINKDKQYVSDITKKIKEACDNAANSHFKFSISLGSAKKNEFHANSEAVMNLAEERMYRNKLLEKNSSRGSTIISLERSLYEKHSETEEHTLRIRNLSSLLGKKLGLSRDKIDELELLGMLHDIGKIAIPDNVLMKPGKLTNAEWEIMKSHTEIGYRIATATPELAHIAHEILCHHEKYDGTGYPQGLKGEEIPLLSRIINIVDSFDVMTHSRCYKDPMSLDDAIEELRRCSGTQFDPDIVEVFIKALIEG
ncbi:MAG: HD domain-containing phosphohydrolase [Clostridiaceae bacterium]